MKRIVLTGGGTAGHVTPNLALIPGLLEDGWDIHYIGREDGIERELVSGIAGVTYHAVASGKLRRYFSLQNFTDPFKVIKGVFQSASIVRKLKPDIVFSKGGFVSVPVVYGAALNRIPALIHESDMTAGLANKLTKPFAKKLLCTFPEAAEAAGSKGVHVGTPIRDDLMHGDAARAREKYGLKQNKPVLLVMGGSSGAQAINRCVRQALGDLLEGFQIIHLTGRGNLDASLLGTEGYAQVEYLNDGMNDAYAAADILISRAGSNSLCEILALRKPALLIPYPKEASRGDQILNAQSFESRKLARVLMQNDMTPETLVENLNKAYRDRGMLIDAMEKEKGRDSVKLVLDLIRQYAK